MNAQLQNKFRILESKCGLKLGEICKALDLPQMACDLFTMSEDEWREKYPVDYIKLRSHRNRNEDRSVLEIGQNTAQAWIDEELAIRLLQRASCVARIERNGTDQKRTFDYKLHTKSVPDLVLYFKDESRHPMPIEITACNGNYIATHHGQDLRLDKLQHLQDFGARLITIDYFQNCLYYSNASKLLGHDSTTSRFQKKSKFAQLEDDNGIPVEGVKKIGIPNSFWAVGVIRNVKGNTP